LSKIAKVKLSQIDPNPMRQLAVYPYNEDKLDTLQRSIHDVGMWPGVIVRESGDRYQQAFAHHRTEAGRRELGADAEIEVIVQDLDDEQMLRYMGRENSEDFNSDFFLSLEAWEAAEQFVATHGGESSAIAVARVLGWTRPNPNRKGDMIDSAAQACSAASELLKGGYFQRSELSGLNVSQARAIVERVVGLQKQVERVGRRDGESEEEIAYSKKIAAGAGKLAAEGVREGRVAHKDIRGSVDVHAYRIGRAAERRTPLFEVFAKTLADQINRFADDDSTGRKLADVVKALKQDRELLMPADVRFVEALAVQCGMTASRLRGWQNKLVADKPEKKAAPAKPVPWKQIGRRAV
jgi:ParB-like chromosome segregation protein Spo0J